MNESYLQPDCFSMCGCELYGQPFHVKRVNPQPTHFIHLWLSLAEGDDARLNPQRIYFQNVRTRQTREECEPSSPAINRFFKVYRMVVQQEKLTEWARSGRAARTSTLWARQACRSQRAAMLCPERVN